MCGICSDKLREISIKPCDCGNTPEPQRNDMNWWVECNDEARACLNPTTAFYTHKDNAISAWNNRKFL